MVDTEHNGQMKTLIALFRLAHAEEIERARTAIRADNVNAAVLDGSKKLVPAGKLRATVMKKTGTSARTFSDRVADLLALGVLEKEGGGPTTQYRATGLI